MMFRRDDANSDQKSTSAERLYLIQEFPDKGFQNQNHIVYNMLQWCKHMNFC